jgi:uncharacterized protein DUF11
MRRLTTVVLFVSVLLGGSAAALVTRGESPKPTPPPVKRLLTDTLEGQPAEPAPPGDNKAAPQGPAPAADNGSGHQSSAGSAGSAQPASPPPARTLGPLQTSGGNPLAGITGANYAGYASGTVVHADALQNGGTRLADVEVAFSGAAYTSAALGGIKNEVSRVVTPALEPIVGNGKGYGRGTGLEVGLAVAPSGPNQIVLPSLVQATAPPNTSLLNQEVAVVNLDRLAFARLLRGQAQGRARADNGCVTLSDDLGYGLGYATDLGLLDTAPNPGTQGLDSPLVSVTASDPDRAASQSVSRTTLVPGVKTPSGVQRFGLVSETRETIAPVTFLKGTPNQFTLEVAGEWVLQVTANGVAGSFHYGPGTASPETPVVRTIDSAGKVTNVLTLQQLLTNKGLNLTIPGVAEIAIGEAPRALGGAGGTNPTASATSSSAAVDVARVKLLESGDNHAADVRVGHMEAAVAVPEGGITCGIGLAKASSKESVTGNEEFTWTVTVSNPHDCTLIDVGVVDTITASDPGITFALVSHSPPATTTANSLTWTGLGPIAPGGSLTLTINMRVTAARVAGQLTDTVVATGKCGRASADGTVDAASAVALDGTVTLKLPNVTPTAVEGAVENAAVRQSEALPKTGGGGAPLTGVALLGVSGVLGSLKRRCARSPLER